MGAFLNNRLTKAGILAAAKALAGETIVFTKITMGDGDPEPGTDLDDLQAVVSPRVDIDITRTAIFGDSVACLGGVFTNNTQHDGFYWRELGLYCQDPDEGEILFSYAYSGEIAEYIPASGSATLVEKNIDILTNVGNTATMKVYISPDAYPTKRDFDDLMAVVNQIKITAQQAVNIAEDAKRIAEEALRIAMANEDKVDDFDGRLRSLEGAVFENVTSNPFSVTFGDLAGITLEKGVWNKDRSRLECSKAA